jgi:hypothetical protein
MRPLKYVATITVPMALLLLSGFQNGGQDASRGDVAAGEVISSDDAQLRLNTTPCENAATIVFFHKPYRKLRSDRGACGGRQYERVQVEQE